MLDAESPVLMREAVCTVLMREAVCTVQLALPDTFAVRHAVTGTNRSAARSTGLGANQGIGIFRAKMLALPMDYVWRQAHPRNTEPALSSCGSQASASATLTMRCSGA